MHQTGNRECKSQGLTPSHGRDQRNDEYRHDVVPVLQACAEIGCDSVFELSIFIRIRAFEPFGKILRVSAAHIEFGEVETFESLQQLINPSSLTSEVVEQIQGCRK